MNPTKKSILIKDESKLLFFAWELLQKLNDSSYSIYLDQSKGYGEFLKHFPNLLLSESKEKHDLIINITSQHEAKEKIGQLNYIINANEGGLLSPDDPIDFFDLIDSYFSNKDFNRKNILITAGPTAEDIDPVRYLTNRSTGKMGIAIARSSFIRGADVKVILGPGSVKIPSYIDVVKVRSAEEMSQAVQQHFEWCDYFMSSSAVADYTPVTRLENKMKKGVGNLSLEMKRTKDILQSIQKIKNTKQKVIGFSVETENLIENSRKKLIRKKMDLIVANNPNLKGAGFAGDTNQVEIITKSDHITLPLLSKKETADKILDYILESKIDE